MQFVDLKEQPKISLSFPDGDVILTRRHIPARQSVAHEEQMKALSERYQNKEIDFLQFADQFLKAVCSGYDESLLDKISIHDMASVVSAVKGMLASTRVVSESEKKSV